MYPAADIVKYDCLVKMVNCLIELYRVQFRFVVNVYCICTVLYCTVLHQTDQGIGADLRFPTKVSQWQVI